MIRPSGNLIGPTVARLRNARGWSQADFAARLQRLGFDASREVLARIEGRVRCVTDAELVFLARALDVEIADLFERKAVASLLKSALVSPPRDKKSR